MNQSRWIGTAASVARDVRRRRGRTLAVAGATSAQVERVRRGRVRLALLGKPEFVTFCHVAGREETRRTQSR